MKKVIGFVIAVCLFGTTAQARDIFYDVNTQTEGGRAIYAMNDKGIISGYGNGLFGPEDTLTRAQAVKIINRVFMYETPAEIDFADVSADAWYYNDVAIAVNAGYIKGYGNGLFGPDDCLTREQVCVMLDNIMGFAMLPIDVPLNDAVSPWAAESVRKMLSNFLISTDEYGNFRATEDITREETCVILVQFVLDEVPVIPEFDLKSVAREELEGRITRIITGIREDLVKRTEIPKIQKLFYDIADNMEMYLNDPNHDYKAGTAKAKADYSRLKKEYRKEARSLMVEFFLDTKYTDDLDILYEFFF